MWMEVWLLFEEMGDGRKGGKEERRARLCLFPPSCFQHSSSMNLSPSHRHSEGLKPPRFTLTIDQAQEWMSPLSFNPPTLFPPPPFFLFFLLPFLPSLPFPWRPRDTSTYRSRRFWNSRKVLPSKPGSNFPLDGFSAALQRRRDRRIRAIGTVLLPKGSFLSSSSYRCSCILRARTESNPLPTLKPFLRSTSSPSQVEEHLFLARVKSFAVVVGDEVTSSRHRS